MNFLASYPRSGNSFLRYVIEKLYGVATYSYYEKDIYAPDRYLEILPEKQKNNPCLFVKTHTIFHAFENTPAIYLVRDGRDALVSHAFFDVQTGRAGKTGQPFQEVLRDLILGVHPSYTGAYAWDWGKHVKAWTQRQAPTYRVRFCDLIATPGEVVDKAVKTLRIPITKVARTSDPFTFEDMKRLHPQLVRRGVVGDHENVWTPELDKMFWDRYGTAMEILGYAET